MPYTPYVVDQFGGLNAIGDPLEVGATGSVAQLNVDLDRLGRVRTRDGWSLLGSAASTLAPANLAYFNSVGTGAEFILARSAVGVTTPYNLSGGTAGTTVATEAGSSNGYARFGDPTNTRLYLGDLSTTLQRFDGTAWTGVSTGTFSAEHLAVSPLDNRLVVARGSTIAFSDAGAPETWTATSFVRVHPGDGEVITGLVTWRDYVFVFKQSKFYIFYGTSTDSSGSPVFNYRTVNVGRGCYGAGGAVAGSEGVYFADRFGVYVTTGDAPRCISRQIEGLLNGTVTLSGASFSLQGPSQTGPVMAYYDRRLYVNDTTNGTTLVYDPALDAWMVWSVGVSGMASVPTTSNFRGVYFGNTGTKKLASIGGTTDNASAVAWSYQSGGYDISGNNRVAIVPESGMWGTGTVTLQVANDFGSVDTGSAVSLGVSPAVAHTYQPVDREGTFWQFKLSGSGPATVNRVVHYVGSVKNAGIG